MDLVNGATSFLPNDCKANASHYQNKSKPLSDERRRGQRILLSCKWQIILVFSLVHQKKSFQLSSTHGKIFLIWLFLPNVSVFAKMVKQTSSCQSWTHNWTIVWTGNACRRTIRVADCTSCRNQSNFEAELVLLQIWLAVPVLWMLTPGCRRTDVIFCTRWLWGSGEDISVQGSNSSPAGKYRPLYGGPVNIDLSTNLCQ